MAGLSSSYINWKLAAAGTRSAPAVLAFAVGRNGFVADPNATERRRTGPVRLRPGSAVI